MVSAKGYKRKKSWWGCRMCLLTWYKELLQLKMDVQPFLSIEKGILFLYTAATVRSRLRNRAEQNQSPKRDKAAFYSATTPT